MICPIQEASQVAAARRTGVEMARGLGFDEAGQGRIALILTEMGTNIVKHAARGEIAIDSFADAGGSGLEIVSLDKGNGIPNLATAMQDGMSTAGTPGNGLGTIRRQSDQFEVFSRPQLGTVIVARVRKSAASDRPETHIGALNIPYPGEAISGDAWNAAAAPGGLSIIVVDGSGHGAAAQSAAKQAIDAFGANLAEPLTRIVELIHRAIAHTRGAAVAVARFDAAAGMVRFVGVGNIAGALVSGGETRRLVSYNGIVGHVVSTIREFTYPYSGKPTLILHSDGLSAKWDLGAYPGLTQSHPSLVSGILFRDFYRGRDDASIVTVRAA